VPKGISVEVDSSFLSKNPFPNCTSFFQSIRLSRCIWRSLDRWILYESYDEVPHEWIYRKGIQICWIAHVMIFYILGLRVPSSGLCSSCSIQIEWLYEITSILPHIMGNLGDIPIFPGGLNYHCLAFNLPLTIKLNVNNPSSSLWNKGRFRFCACFKQFCLLHITISLESIIFYEELLNSITCCRYSTVFCWGLSRRGSQIGSVIDF